MRKQQVVMAMLSALIAATGVTRAQGTSPATFEVASLKKNTQSGEFQSLRVGPGDRVTAVNVTLRTLLQEAFQVSARNIVGGPGWLDSERFDVAAKAAEPTSAERLRLMLQTLVTERFKMVWAIETRDQPIYALVVARSDQRLGPQLKRATEDCATLRASMPVRERGGGEPPCGVVRSIGKLAARGLPLAQLAGMLSPDARRRVVDETGLEGNFDWQLTYTPPAVLEFPGRFPQIDPNGPPLVTALQEQLGLRLEPRQGPGKVLVLKQVQGLIPN